MSIVIHPGDTVFIRTYIPQWLAEEMAAVEKEIDSQLGRVQANADLYEPRLMQLRAERSGLIGQGEDIRDTARAQLESVGDITIIDLSLGENVAAKFGKHDDFPEVVAIYRGGTKDMLGEFSAFIRRYIARRGEVSTEEMSALYEDFHGIELKKGGHGNDRDS